jgi:carbamoyl-phosphate synthase large subunit
MTDAKINILVTAAGGGGVGEQILKSLVMANETHGKYHIIAGDMNMDCPQVEMADEFRQLPAANDPKFIETILGICDERSCQAVFYGCEPDLKTLSKSRHLFEERNILLPLNPQNVIDDCMDKVRTGKLLSSLGFEPPRWIEIGNFNDLNDINFFPVIVKPAVGSGGSNHCYIAQNLSELKALYQYLELALPGQKLVVQEYVGDCESEYTVGVLMDMDGNYINAIAMNRFLRSQLNVRAKYPNNTGKKELGSHLVISSGISHGRLGRYSQITEKCRDIAEAIGARGAINIQLRYVNGDLKIFEINPRFSGTTSLRSMVGYNEPDVLIRRHILNEEITADFEYKGGVILRSLKEDLVVDN